MALSAEYIELVALGAAVGGNCIPCLEWHFKKCIELGIPLVDVIEAIEMAKKVRQVPIEKMNDTIEILIQRHGTSK